MSAATWSQGGPPSQKTGPIQGPPPSCFNCGGQHYLVNCPEQKRPAHAGPTITPAISTNHQQPGYSVSGGRSGQQLQWASSQNGSAVTPYAARPKPRPVFTGYTAPSTPQQFGSVSGSYVTSAAVPSYQQYPGSVPPGQSYPLPQASYPPNPQQYESVGAPHTYNNQAPLQSYSAPSAALQYVNTGYQIPPQNQYSQINGPQYGAPGYQNPQQYALSPVGAAYQTPANIYQSQNNSYTGPSPVQNQTPQWASRTTTPSYAAPPLLQQQNDPSFDKGYKREYSGPPRQQSMPQPHQTFKRTPSQENGSDTHQGTPQTPASFSKPTLPPLGSDADESPMNQARFPALSVGSKSSSRASTPHPRRESTCSLQHKERTQSATPSMKAAEGLDPTLKDRHAYEDVESTEADRDEQEFNWELEMIFLEQPMTENVRLAQPLSTTWESTPVPLLDNRLNNSVSRYARKDNLKDFMQPIRSQPQWSYLKDDPVFSDPKVEEGPLISLHDVPAWMAARHGTEVPDPGSTSLSRKRARSAEEDEQEDIDHQTELAAVTENTNENTSNKRQKTEDEDIIVQTSNTPTGRPGTPTLGRAGTPAIGAENDVWAPQPGEGAASAPFDPTEALLASLGVSGSPKPVRKGSTTALSIPESTHSTPSYNVYAKSISPQNNQPAIPHNMPPQAKPAYNNPTHSTSEQFHPPYNSFSDGYAQQGHNANGMSPQGSSHTYQQDGLPRQKLYNRTMSPPGSAPYNNQPYTMPKQNSFGHNMSPQGNLPQTGQPYGMPRQNSYSHGMPQHNVPVYNNHPHVMPPPQQYPLQTQYSPNEGHVPHANYSQQVVNVVQNPHYGNSSYSVSSQPYLSTNQHNGVPQHNSAPYPQNSSDYTQVSTPYDNSTYSNPPHRVAQNGHPPDLPYNNNSQGFQTPSRQDSGYVSARGSYSHGSGMNQGPPTMPPQEQHPEQGQFQTRVLLDGGNDTPTPPKPEPAEANFFASLPSQFPRKGNSKALQLKLVKAKTEGINEQEGEISESPLTPMSMEILGKLAPSNDGGKKSDSSRQEDVLARKVKRPQPVVAAAYGRRW